MNDLRRAFYEATLKNVVWEKTANAYQDFFSDVMNKCYPGDFISSRTWGSMGDKKNDGYLQSRRTLFAVYAPDNGPANNTVAKMESDYSGGVAHWKDRINCWIFVHNAVKGISPTVVEKLLELDARIQEISVKQWNFEVIRQLIFGLSEPDVAALLGPAPSEQDMMDLRFSDIQDVLDEIAEQDPPPNADIRPVPSDKLERNELSSDIKTLLENGMQKSDLVSDYFAQYLDPMFGDRVVQAFKEKYQRCRDLPMSPDRIFLELQKFTGGEQLLLPRRQAAVLAVLAYLFEQCDIFERPNGNSSL